MVTVVDSSATAARCRSTLSGEMLLALDCEGVNLGRRGEVSIIQIATTSMCFLLDVQCKTAATVALAKEILENDSICKIIHDCRADSDALKHLLSITLKNVHDTQVAHTDDPKAHPRERTTCGEMARRPRDVRLRRSGGLPNEQVKCSFLR